MQAVVERVINLLIYLLESSQPVSADDIRQTVLGYGDQNDEAFHRMFERDKDVLRRLGVPLEMQPFDAWEVDFGYVVDPEKYAIPDPELTEQERVALSVAAKMVRLGGGQAGLDGLHKLGGSERGIGLEPLGADLGAESEALGDLFRAVTEKREIDFRYRGEKRTLQPYGLAHRRGHWYVTGATPNGDRLYRVDRVERITVSEERDLFARPKTFDVRSIMNTHPWEAGGDEVVTARIRFDESVAWWAGRTLGEQVEEGKDLVTSVPVSNLDAFVGWVLSFGAAAEVLEPVEIRSEIRQRVGAAMKNAG